MKKIILATCIALLCFNCSNDDDSNNALSVVYEQTFCADPWGYANNDSDLAGKLTTFFETTSIDISLVKFDTKGTQQVCNACSCLSGKRIFVVINPVDLDAIKVYGFREFN